MKLSDVASVAEIIAGAGVILSLLFVGLELNEGNTEARAGTLQAATDSELALNSEFLRYASTWEKVVTQIPLEDGAETRRGIVLYQMSISEFENRWAQFEAGYFDEAEFEARKRGLQRLVRLPLFEQWSDSIGATLHSPRFMELVSTLRKDQL